MPITNKIKNEEYWIEKFHEQESAIKEKLENLAAEERASGFRGNVEVSSYKQCLDKESFDMRFYNPAWVVCSEGYVWSLHYKRLIGFIHEEGFTNQQGNYSQSKWKVHNSYTETRMHLGKKSGSDIPVHQLVANYYCDKLAVRMFGEKNCVVHHILGYKYFNDYRWMNRAAHLQYISIRDHELLNAIQRGIPFDKLANYGIESDRATYNAISLGRNTAGKNESKQKLDSGIEFIYCNGGTEIRTHGQAAGVDQPEEASKIWLKG